MVKLRIKGRVFTAGRNRPLPQPLQGNRRKKSRRVNNPVATPPGNAGVPPAPSKSKTNGKRHPTRERGRPARMHCRSDSLSLPTTYHPPTRRQERRATGQSSTLARLPVESDWRKRAKAVPRTLRKRRPPGNAGVPPACTAVAIHSVCLRCITHQRRRQERRVNPAAAEP